MSQAHHDDDLYGLLGVHAAASFEEIRRAYRKSAMTWHPDRNVSPHAEETFKRIRSAYETLRDAQRRAEYDRHAATRTRHAPRPQPEVPSEPPSGRAPNLSRRARITLMEQLHGARVRLRLTRTEYCRRCGGSGDDDGPPVGCATCGGSGRVRQSLGLFAFFRTEAVPCKDCDGKGAVRPKCRACEGRGVDARKSGHLSFSVPAGVQPGAGLRVRGHGRRGRGNEASGDLLVRIEIARHPLFEPDFPHLRCDMPVNIFQVLAGGSLEVPTLGGAVALGIGADWNDGTELRIAGEGMLDGSTGQRGDLLVTLRLVRPDTLSDAQRELLVELERSAASAPDLIDWARRRRDAEKLRRPRES